ncbi:MAG: glycosyltransferase [Rhodoferax sp.]|nr:glycosyltransferase [Rhodoferax sp.]
MIHHSNNPPQGPFRPINVIVPIYRGIEETRRCLESLLSSQLPEASQITLIDDCGPEPEMASLLTEFGKCACVTLLRNPQNLGFVASVNRGMTFLPTYDPLLLNADTEVPPGWAQRLQRALYATTDIGTVTPFSNNATICSYPRFCNDNELPTGMTVVQLDQLFHQTNAGHSIDIPTAVGFCMLIRRECLDEVGLFDLERFGRGYGEENDFCMRATHRGWRHVLRADTFVYHAGAVSFASEHDARVSKALAILVQRHPRYPLLVRRHVLADPAARYRHRVDLMRLGALTQPTILFVCHDLGGGVLRHVEDLAQQFEGKAQFILLRAAAGHQIEVSWCKRGEAMRLLFHRERDWQDLCAFIAAIKVLRIHFHHWLGLPEAIWKLPEQCKIPYDVTIHDYHTICPRLNLVDQGNRYCGEPDESGCDRCMARTPRVQGGIALWRDQWHSRLRGADRLLAPSRDVAIRLTRYYPDLTCTVAPHPEPITSPPAPKPPAHHNDSPLKVIAIGALAPIKGGALLEDCARDAAARDLPLRFHLIGYGWRPLSAPDNRLKVTGAYRDKDLPELIALADADIAWFPALWPETYSYTLSAAIAAGLPIAATDLGAPPERLEGRHWTWLCDWRWSAREWNDFFLYLRTRHFLTASPPKPLDAVPHATWDWSTDYLPRTPQSSIVEPKDLLAYADDHSHARLAMTERGLLAVRHGILLNGLRIRRHPALGRLIGLIPVEVQHLLRRWILGLQD